MSNKYFVQPSRTVVRGRKSVYQEASSYVAKVRFWGIETDSTTTENVTQEHSQGMIKTDKLFVRAQQCPYVST
jgi:hypothetical protein